MLTGNSFAFDWEVQLMSWLQSRLGEAGISIVSFFSAFGEELILIVIMGFLYWCYNKQIGKRIGTQVLMGLVWNPMIKNVFLRRRPYFDHEDIQIYRIVEPEADPLDIAAQGFSFPSGHSTNAAIVYGSLALMLKKKWMMMLAFLVPLLVGLSRIVVGAHFPTDVMAGWFLGLLAVGAVNWLRRKLRNDRLFYGVLLLSALPGLFYCKSNDYYSGLGLMIGFFAGILLEEHRVRFANTRNPLRAVLRILGGGVLFFCLNQGLKLPFSEAFLESGSLGARLVRMIRYAVVAFVEFGVYPLLFNWAGKRFPDETAVSRQG